MIHATIAHVHPPGLHSAAARTRSQVRDWMHDRSMILINSCSLPACDLPLPPRPWTILDGDPRVFSLTAVLAVQDERERGRYGGGRTYVLWIVDTRVE